MKSRFSTLYKVLGVNQLDSQEQIKQAYLKLVKIHHPDVSGNIERFKEIANAYEILKDPLKRADYNIKIQYETLYQQPNNTNHQQYQQQDTKERKYQYSHYKSNNWNIILIFGGVFIIYTVTQVPERRQSQSPQTEQLKTYEELEDMYNQIQANQKQSNIIKQDQSQLRRQNMFLSQENINDSPQIIEQRRIAMEQERIHKKFKIEVEHFESVIKGDTKILKRKDSQHQQKHAKQINGEMTLAGFASNKKMRLYKSQPSEAKPVNIDELEQGYI